VSNSEKEVTKNIDCCNSVRVLDIKGSRGGRRWSKVGRICKTGA